MSDYHRPPLQKTGDNNWSRFHMPACHQPVDLPDWSAFLARPFLPTFSSDGDGALAGKTVLVTGAGGSIGSALAQKLMDGRAATLLLLDHSRHNLATLFRQYQDRDYTIPNVEFFQTDIRDGSELQKIFSWYKPNVVFHAAAMKHLAPLESDPFGALDNNVVGTFRLIEKAKESQVELFVNVSTDKAVNPTSVLGISKRISELLLKASDSPATRWISIRLGNVLGSSDSVVPLFLHAIGNHQPLPITDPNASRYFVTVEEVVNVLMNCVDLPYSALLLPDMGSERSILDLAGFLIRHCASDGARTTLKTVGLRDGEKRNEELTYDYEYLVKTTVPRLYRIYGRSHDGTAFLDNLARLAESISGRRTAGLIQALRAMVPEFTPSPTLLRHLQ